MPDRLKVMMKPRFDGEMTPLLCDQNGDPLPGQTRVEIVTQIDDVAHVRVDFAAVEFG